MSRFWAAGNSYESEDESETESEEDNAKIPAGGGRFGAAYEDSESGTYESTNESSKLYLIPIH
jgi:hypothetical protein